MATSWWKPPLAYTLLLAGVVFIDSLTAYLNFLKVGPSRFLQIEANPLAHEWYVHGDPYPLLTATASSLIPFTFMMWVAYLAGVFSRGNARATRVVGILQVIALLVGSYPVAVFLQGATSNLSFLLFGIFIVPYLDLVLVLFFVLVSWVMLTKIRKW